MYKIVSGSSLYPDDPIYPQRELRAIRRIVIHTVTDDIDVIYNTHTKINKWEGVGFHAIIDKDGDLYMFGILRDVRAHVIDQNYSTIGIAVQCNGQPSEYQLATLRDYITTCGTITGRDLPVVPHSELDTKVCCPSNWKEWGYRLAAHP
jgi:hypothetical protein